MTLTEARALCEAGLMPVSEYLSLSGGLAEQWKCEEHVSHPPDHLLGGSSPDGLNLAIRTNAAASRTLVPPDQWFLHSHWHLPGS